MAEPGQEPEPGRLPAFLSSFAYRGYRLVWLGAILSGIGTWTQDVALAWLIHVELGNPVYLGLRSFAAEAPLVGFMLIGGAVADRFDRRLVLLAAQVAQMASALALLVLHLVGALGIGAILLLAFLTGLAQSQSAPTYQAVITTLVPPRLIPNAIALNSLQFNLARAVGPVVAGVLLVQAGSGACFFVNVISYLAVIGALLRVGRLPRVPRSDEGLGRSLAAGLRHVAATPQLSLLTALAATSSLLGFPLITYLPVVADEALGLGAAGFSLLMTSFGTGAIVGALVTAQRGHVPGRGRSALAALVLFGLATTGAVAAPRQELAAALLFGAGFGLVSALSILNSLVQEQAPEALRGRIVSVYGLAFRGGAPLGSLLAGFLVQRFGAPSTLASFAVLLILVALAVRAHPRTARVLP